MYFVGFLSWTIFACFFSRPIYEGGAWCLGPGLVPNHLSPVAYKLASNGNINVGTIYIFIPPKRLVILSLFSWCPFCDVTKVYFVKKVLPDMTATSAWFSSLSLWLSDFSCDRVWKKSNQSQNIKNNKLVKLLKFSQGTELSDELTFHKSLMNFFFLGGCWMMMLVKMLKSLCIK